MLPIRRAHRHRYDNGILARFIFLRRPKFHATSIKSMQNQEVQPQNVTAASQKPLV